MAFKLLKFCQEFFVFNSHFFLTVGGGTHWYNFVNIVMDMEDCQ
jgi:hypothetical protein